MYELSIFGIDRKGDDKNLLQPLSMLFDYMEK